MSTVRRPLESQDHYEVLGVSPKCSQEEILKAFRRNALRYHPDRNGSPGAADIFKTVNAAYQVLGDPERRRRYDAERRWQLWASRSPSGDPSAKHPMQAAPAATPEAWRPSENCPEDFTKTSMRALANEYA